jgi:hypothetical protein
MGQGRGKDEFNNANAIATAIFVCEFYQQFHLNQILYQQNRPSPSPPD